ncbi:MAG: DUF2169 domain-containing protein [Pseudomonadota bacterium]|nr:DUF2169 domain-containing protein [Pseudomonadota bacterium]
MWTVINRTPYAAEGGWVQDKDGHQIWLVAVKASFDLPPGRAPRLAREQRPVLRMSEPRGEEGASSCRYESDLLGVKPGTDLLVEGSAWARQGQLARHVDVAMRVGPVQKQLRVFGDRSWRRSPIGTLQSTPPEPFEALPIVFERAYGGWDRAASDPAQHRLEMRNPVGVGFFTDAAHAVGKALPNIEDPRHLIASWDDRPSPAGFTCVSCDWSPRRELAGSYDDEWQARRAPLWAEDFDRRYYQCAPPDQQIPGHLRGGETVELHNLCAQGSMEFSLPTVDLIFESRFGDDRVEHEARLATVIIEPDLRRLTMTWQTSLLCDRRVDTLDYTSVSMRQNR